MTTGAPHLDTDVEPVPAAPPWERALVPLAALVVTVALAVHVAPWITDGFGVSHDGYNASMWGLGARAAWDDPLGSRLGGIQPSGFAYANHPPLLVWITTLTAGVGGEAPLAVRAPALLSSLAAFGALALLLRDAGLRPLSVAAGLLAAGTTGMFLTYGAMLDTPVVALPFGLAAVAVSQRAWQGRPVPPGLAVVVGALAALAGWQALLAAALGAGACLLSPAGDRRAAAPLLAGAGAGTLVALGWIVWVKGSFGKLVEQAGLRSGGATGRPWLEAQSTHLGDLLGAPLLVLTVVGLGAALLARRRRPLLSDPDGGAAGDPSTSPSVRARWRGPAPVAAVLGLTVVAYTVVFREASTVHDYWTYWSIALVAVGVAALAGAVQERVATSRPPVRRAVGAAAALVVLALAAWGVGHRSDADAAIQEGAAAVPVLAAIPQATDPEQVTVAVRNAEAGAPWAAWASRGTVLRPSTQEIAALAPDTLLFLRANGTPPAALQDAALAVEGPFLLVRVADYREALGS